VQRTFHLMFGRSTERSTRLPITGDDAAAVRVSRTAEPGLPALGAPIFETAFDCPDRYLNRIFEFWMA